MLIDFLSNRIELVVKKYIPRLPFSEFFILKHFLISLSFFSHLNYHPVLDVFITYRSLCPLYVIVLLLNLCWCHLIQHLCILIFLEECITKTKKEMLMRFPFRQKNENARLYLLGFLSNCFNILLKYLLLFLCHFEIDPRFSLFVQLSFYLYFLVLKCIHVFLS